ncbi:HAD family hydrolase [bacterium]|nr:HAD family hydrolase [bacterium]
MDKKQRMIVGLDIDGTITAAPEFFRMLSEAVYREGGKVIIVSARSNTALTRTETQAEMRLLGIRYSKLILLPEGAAMLGDPPPELSYLERYLWQKVHICEAEGVQVFFDDDDTVLDLFSRYAEQIQVFHALKPFRLP